MIYWLLGISSYAVSAWMSYDEGVKARWWFVWAGILVGTVASFCWMSIAKNNLDKEGLYYQAFVWDALIVLIYAAMPLLLAGVKLTPIQYLGAAFVVVGLLIFKL